MLSLHKNIRLYADVITSVLISVNFIFSFNIKPSKSLIASRVVISQTRSGEKLARVNSKPDLTRQQVNTVEMQQVPVFVFGYEQ